MPLSEPKIISRDATPYAAIALTVNQPDIGQVAPPLVPEILGWLETHAKPTGPVFFNYRHMDGGKMDMEVGAPIAAAVKGDARVTVGTLPGGRYISATWTGPYDQLHNAHMQVHDWCAKHKLKLGDTGGKTTLLEIYHTDPDEIADPQQWVTEIAFWLGN
jgi:effector-binding domain-containing protein